MLYHFSCSSYFFWMYITFTCVFWGCRYNFCHAFFVYNLDRSGLQCIRHLLVSVRKLPNHDILDKIHILKIHCCLQIFIILIKLAFYVIVFAWKPKHFSLADFLNFLFFLHDFSGISVNIGEYFTDHHTPNAIRSFRDSVLVRIMHDCYSRIRKNFEQHFILMQALQVITTSR